MSKATIRTVLDAMRDGRITRVEADAYLKERLGTTLEQEEPMPRETVLMAAGLVLVIVAAIGLLGQGALTGFVTYSAGDTNITNTSYIMNTSLTSLTASGTMYGEGNATITFETGTGTYLVAMITSDPGLPRTTMPSYIPGENVTLDHAPSDATYYLDDGQETIAIDLPFPAPETEQELLIVANETGGLTTYRIPILIGNVPRTTMFTDECTETCFLSDETGVVHVITEGDTSLDLNLTGEETGANNPPVLSIEYDPITVNGSAIVNISGHFTDADEDELFYSISGTDLVDARLEGTILTLDAILNGTETLRIYVSDLEDLVEAAVEVVSIPIVGENETTVTGNETTGNQTSVNTSVNETEINETINVTTPVQNGTLNITNGTLDCSHPDPNQRPVDCLTAEAVTYFEEDVFWEDVPRQKVARLTPIGNLILRGRVLEYSTLDPEADDFAINYKGANFRSIPAAWIDDQGNLHLKGALYEENNQLTPPSGSYVTINRRGVYLAYIDRQAGDLYIRGNVIPYREDVTR